MGTVSEDVEVADGCIIHSPLGGHEMLSAHNTQEQGKLEEGRHLESLSTSLESASPILESFTERESAGELHVYYARKDISSVLRATLISHLCSPQSSRPVGGLLQIKVQLIISLFVFPLFSFWRHEL